MSNRNLLERPHAFIGFRPRYRTAQLGAAAARPVRSRVPVTRGVRGAAWQSCTWAPRAVARGRLVETTWPLGGVARGSCARPQSSGSSASPCSFLEQLLPARTTNLSCLKFINYLTGCLSACRTGAAKEPAMHLLGAFLLALICR